jgi:hypothetical protein
MKPRVATRELLIESSSEIPIFRRVRLAAFPYPE